MKVLILFALTVTVSGQLITDGLCPETSIAQNDFNIKKFTEKKWYTVFSYDHKFGVGEECGFFTLKPIDDHSFEIENCRRVNGEKTCFYGKEFLMHPEKVPNDGHFRVELPDTEKLTVSNAVLLSDYETYVIGYACENLKDQSKEYLWVGTAEVNPPKTVMEKIDGIVTKHFNKSQFKTYKHDETCDYSSVKF